MTAAEISEKTGIEARCYTRTGAGGDGAARGQEGAREIGPKAGRNRRRAVLQLHQHAADSFGGHVVLRRTGSDADPQLLRHRRRLRRHALRGWRGDPTAAGDRTPGAAGVRRKILRQDRHRAHLAHDFRRRRGSRDHRARARRRGLRHRDFSDLCQRPVVGGELHHLAQSRVRQQHHGLWA